MVVVVFPGSLQDAPAQHDDTKWKEQIEATGKSLLLGDGGWGRIEDIKSCYDRR